MKLISMIKMRDKEINEVRKIRHEISARFGHDIGQLVAHYQKIEEEFRRSGEYKFADSKKSEIDGKTKTM